MVEEEATLVMPLGGVTDLDKERARLDKEIGRLEGEIARVGKKWAMPTSFARAPW